jgi:hypothetical protein
MSLFAALDDIMNKGGIDADVGVDGIDGIVGVIAIFK